MRPQWVQSVVAIQAELYRMSKMFEALSENTLDSKLFHQAMGMKARCVNLGMRYFNMSPDDALYPVKTPVTRVDVSDFDVEKLR